MDYSAGDLVSHGKLRKITSFRRRPNAGRRGSSADGAGSDASSTISTPGEALPQMSRDRSYLQDLVQTPSRRSSDPQAGDHGPRGISVVHSPLNEPHRANIVFVHGLGGTSRKTWSKDADPALFWPLQFLPLESDLRMARILTFGYNADFQKPGSVNTSVLDFAKELLFDLKHARNEQGEELDMEKVPLIFVVHSMGGLIIKEAYIQGQHDPQYEDIIRAISAIIFLSTPHRGTNLAQTLNRILQSTLGVTSAKYYVSELSKSSFTLQRLNEQFRHIAPSLDIVSFYETLPTPIGFKNTKVMVLEKESSVLGYPGEISKPLTNADHHGVCKYESPDDPNYVTVRNVLKSLFSKILASQARRGLEGQEMAGGKGRRHSTDLRTILGITELPNTDYAFFRDQWVEGTGQWLLQDQAYRQWLLSPNQSPSIIWLTGSAAAGKSVLASTVIDSLVGDAAEGYCQYFFIRFADRKKRTLSLVLRSLAYQMGLNVPGFQQQVLDFADEAIGFDTADSRTIWECIKSALSGMDMISRPIFWIIDGIDEAEKPRTLLKYLADLHSIHLPIRVLLVGRRTNELDAEFQRLPAARFGYEAKPDRACYGRSTEQFPGKFTPPNRNFFASTTMTSKAITDRSGGWQWVHLAVERLNSCYTQVDAEVALEELPGGMKALYDRMAASISAKSSPEREFATKLLNFAACSVRTLKVIELSQALGKDDFFDMQRTVADLCGGFAVIDNGGNFTLVHHSAREYLLDPESNSIRAFGLARSEAHRTIFLSCMRSLTATGLRGQIGRGSMPEFVNYAAGDWSSHLVAAPVGCRETANAMRKFLSGPWVLIWIHLLATTERLGVLVRASKNLSRFAAAAREHDALSGDTHQKIKELELLESWAVDFTKLAGKFGGNLRRNPQSIYKAVPALCPHDSAVYQQFGKIEPRALTVSGFSSNNWDDSLGRLSFGFRNYAAFIQVAGAHVFILISSGTVLIYNSVTLDHHSTSPIKHGERLYRMQANSRGTTLVTYGYRTTKVWQVSSGVCTATVPNIEIGLRPLVMLLKGNTLFVGTDDRCIRMLDLGQQSPVWTLVAELEEQELEGHFLNAASHMALNKDGTMVTVAYRGHPLSAWEADGPTHIGHLWKKDARYRGEVLEAIWHPHEPQVYGLYTTGQIFQWLPYYNEVEEKSIGAKKMAMSPDGNLLATSDARGAVKILTTSTLTIIYQVAAQDLVVGLAFSPDLRRIYDLRGDYGNVWGPNALLRYAEPTGQGTDAESELESLAPSSNISEITPRWVDPIIALEPSPVGRLYCCNTEKGVVTLHDALRGTATILHTSPVLFGSNLMTWSLDGKWLCFADPSMSIYIVSVQAGTSGSDAIIGPPVAVSMQGNTRGPILQLIFQPDGSHIIVHTESTVHLISTAASAISKSASVGTTKCSWIVHPQNPALIVGLGPKSAHVLDWDLVEHETYNISYPTGHEIDNQHSTTTTGPPSQTHALERVLVTHDKKRILVQLAAAEGIVGEKTFLSLEASSLLSNAAPQHNTPAATVRAETKVIRPVILDMAVSSEISLALGFSPSNRLVYLSRSFQVCLWSMSAVSQPPPKAKSTHANQGPTVPGSEIFSLPGDWISRECVRLCCLWPDEKAILCPRNGEVGVIRSSALG
ncbi:hypothetical protein PpBr36_08240 [Pyricularia pennisetigena]|uniref:hypothetical protein n=1 Tax=Pyricularia pennisetigena TaxID=1578925 RepID=UPI001151A28D|nr:hypothetical protein PpBr36_08240 [Pyricularia pennisetigena]TLS23922.1 hypothetical protein PpBr36_08240 [Pyricularia pennisetigena]